ncbi:hypothetical protein [Corynebacterium sp. c7Ub_26]
MNVNDWLNEIKGSDSMRAASKKSGYAQTTLQRQIDKGQLSPEMVIALCRAYEHSPVTGLIETGYINEWETEGVSIPYALRQATNEQILDEINRRSDPEARYLFTNDSDDTLIDFDPGTQTDELAQRRHVTLPAYSDTTPDEEDLPYVADDSPDEPMPGDDNYSDGP